MESFYSIQGEGYHQGAAAYFIRLAGCDVGCHWCDVKESWEASQYPKISVNEIIAGLKVQSPDKVIVTGGEPLMYDLSYLCNQLNEYKISKHLETSGTYPVSGHWDWICFSPKKFKKPLKEIYSKAHELKVVIFNRSDFDWAESFASKVNPNCKLYLQPEWSKSQYISPLITDYVRGHPKWSISLQIHKYLKLR